MANCAPWPVKTPSGSSLPLVVTRMATPILIVSPANATLPGVAAEIAGVCSACVGEGSAVLVGAGKGVGLLTAIAVGTGGSEQAAIKQAQTTSNAERRQAD